MIDAHIGAVFFDAVGTLIHPEPPAATVYWQIGAAHGSRLGKTEIRERFAKFFRAEEQADRDQDWKTNERRELSRWQNIVRYVLDDVADFEECFAEIYEHFHSPHGWTVADDAEAVLGELSRRGLKLGLASNYDHRLHRVLAGMPQLDGIGHVVISSEVGWRKPGRGFFDAVCAVAELPARSVLFVGDDPNNDYKGARDAGLPALLLGPPQQDPAIRHIPTLSNLIA